MIQINPNALYTRSDLSELLKDSGVDVDTFIHRLKPRKVFRLLFFGEDLLQALRNAPSMEEEKEISSSLPAGKNRGNAKGKKGGYLPGQRLREAFRIQKEINGDAKTG